MSLSQQWQENERQIIREFFEIKVPESLDVNVTNPDACDEDAAIRFARIALGTDDIVPVENQGSNSFTMISHEKSVIIQFRLKPFKTEILDLAHKIYGDLVPRTIPHSGFPLPVYTSNIIPGKIYFLQEFPDDDSTLARQLKTVIDLGEFIARASWYPIGASDAISELGTAMSWTKSAPEKLERLIKNQSLCKLAPELIPVVEKLLLELPLLDKLPLVLTHHDLSVINILAYDDGKVSGVIDFDEASPEVLGTCIWSVFESFLGSMEEGKYCFFNQKANPGSIETVREVLEAKFWETLWSNISPKVKTENFEKAIKVAARIGVIERYLADKLLDDIDLNIRAHRYSLEYARNILPAI